MSVTKSNALTARELEWAINTEEQNAEHKSHNGSIIRTRFPPEPNGYLHIGHAKSMNMNFSLAFDKLGVSPDNRATIFRYDDTNPEAESREYIDSLKRDLEWLGWKPERTTYSSDNFGVLHDLAVTLIKKGLAYVCDMSKDEMEAQRDLAKRRSNARNTDKDPDIEAPIPSTDVLPGRNRNTSVERNLALFEEMRLGLFDEGSLTLRLKMDFESSNPNMYDLVAYRIKYVSHPHAGDGWCIYPSYDFTHGICDSIEHIDYSICTLEFETRREPYFWILWALDMYKPHVYEMSRLNLEYTVLSKRRLNKLVTGNHVRGWNDPRMPTISGLRRRGYTSHIINSFCNDVGATRAMNVVEMEKLHQTARLNLSSSSTRLMAAFNPIKVILTNFDIDDDHNNNPNKHTFEVQNSPTDPSLGTHTITLTPVIYIDASDFRPVDDNPKYYGLAPHKAVGIKYHGGNMICDEIIYFPGKKQIQELKCHIDTSPDRPKPKSYLTWVPSNALPCEIRIYNHLFTVPEPTDSWEDELNPNSEIIHDKALIDPSILTLQSTSTNTTTTTEQICSTKLSQWSSNPAYQFERMGYFCLDIDSTPSKLVFNRTVSLKEEKFKKQLTPEEERDIRERRERDLRDARVKEERMKISERDFFKLDKDYVGLFSKFDDATGVPTHKADGTEVTKSATKKLIKERAKFVKAKKNWEKQQQNQKQN